jgi:Flp pilus assembly protein TadG
MRVLTSNFGLRRASQLLLIGRLARDERGIQLAELAIVLPVFLLLFAATAEFGRYFYEYTTLAKAARVGVRYLATAGVNVQSDTVARNLVVYGNTSGTGTPVVPGLTTSNITITRRNSAGGVQTSGVPQTVTVQVTGFKHQPLFDLGGLIKQPSFSLNIDVRPSVTMRYLLTTPVV